MHAPCKHHHTKSETESKHKHVRKYKPVGPCGPYRWEAPASPARAYVSSNHATDCLFTAAGGRGGVSGAWRYQLSEVSDAVCFTTNTTTLLVAARQPPCSLNRRCCCCRRCCNHNPTPLAAPAAPSTHIVSVLPLQQRLDVVVRDLVLADDLAQRRLLGCRGVHGGDLVLVSLHLDLAQQLAQQPLVLLLAFPRQGLGRLRCWLGRCLPLWLAEAIPPTRDAIRHLRRRCSAAAATPTGGAASPIRVRPPPVHPSQ